MGLCEPKDVWDRLEEPPTPNQERAVTAWIEDCSDEVLHITARGWTLVTVPWPVQRLVAKAVARYAVNPDRVTETRAGEEALRWDNPTDTGSYFLPDEKERLLAYNPLVSGGGNGWGTVQVVAEVWR